MPLLRTLTATPGPNIEREAVTYTSVAEFDQPGLYHVFNRAQRPTYRFQVELGPLTKAEAESLSAFHAFHMGGKSFLWDGGAYGRVDNYNLVGEGDGGRREFFIPNRYVGANSFALRTVNQTTGASSNWAASSSNSWPYSLNATPGVFVFANSSNTIPGSGHDIMAQWACQYRCVFEPDGIKLEEIARSLYKATLKLIETALVG